MSITQQLSDLRTNVRRTCDIQGTSATTRHPDAAVNDAVNRGIAALYRLLTQSIPDQRFLSSQSISLVAGTTTYALHATFDRLISVDVDANGARTWIDAYQMPERPALVDTNATQPSIPIFYRLRGANIEFLPTPATSGTATLWFVPDASQLTGDSQTIDTIARLDDYVIWYAARELATKDSKWQLIATLDQRISRIEADVLIFARARDMNAPPRIINERRLNRYGRAPWRR